MPMERGAGNSAQDSTDAVPASFWRAEPDGISMMIKVYPRSRRPALGGLAGSLDGVRLKVAVTEPAEDGKANEAVRVLIAELLDRPKSEVRIVAGTRSRNKRLVVTGDAAALIEKFRAL